MRLKAPEYDHMEIVREWRNKQRPSLRTPYLMTEGVETTFYTGVICNRESPHRYFSVIHKGSGNLADVFLGLGGLVDIQWENRTAELSLITALEETRKLEMFNLLLDEAFQNMGLHSVTGETYACGDIAASEDLVHKYGCYHTILRDRKFWNREFWDSLWFTITEDDYARCRNIDR